MELISDTGLFDNGEKFWGFHFYGKLFLVRWL